jgi:hypothetical protein
MLEADGESYASGLLTQRRWGEAAAAFAAVGAGLSLGGQLKWNLAKNMAAMVVHRPAVAGVLALARVGGEFQVVPLGDGSLTIAVVRDGAAVALSERDGPVAAMSRLGEALRPLMEAGETLAVLGMGDGYLLRHLASWKCELPLGRQQCVWLLEPQAGLVLAALMIHDYTGADGPIEQPRFQWLVGPGMERSYRRMLVDEAELPVPTRLVRQGPTAAVANEVLEKVGRELMEAGEKAGREVEACYAGVGAAEYARAMRGELGRRPRVMLVTTRFSSVLQYSTADAARGFEELGWEARVLMEGQPWHGLSVLRARRMVAEFRPDVIFQLNYSRFDHGRLFPPGVPYVNWIQDHMAHLARREYGAKVGPRDFVLSSVCEMYTEKYGYPARQMVPISKLTRFAELPDSPDGDDEDLVYVSNASATGAELVDEIGRRVDGSAARAVLAEAGGRMMEMYRRGGTMYYHAEALELVRVVQREMGVRLDEAVEGELMRGLFDRLNNALYRQQALEWAGAVAQRRGLRLGIYGKGWEKHPTLGKWARGPVEYGPALERLTRRAKMNLQIIPSSFLHQRYLDAVAAGGFVLVRKHPVDGALQALATFMNRHLPERVQTVEEARGAVEKARAVELEAILAELEPMRVIGDVVGIARGCLQSRMLVERAIAHYDEVGFASEQELDERVGRFVGQQDGRRSIMLTQRDELRGRLSYAAGMKRVMERVAAKLDDEANEMNRSAA